MRSELATIDSAPVVDTLSKRRADELLQEHLGGIYRRTDRLFAHLMVLQWLAGIAAAFSISPRTWVGDASQTHIHVWSAILLGGAITSLPVLLASLRPGAAITRYVIAAAQMLMSALLIHLSGGRIEAHFHVFGSLAFLAAYRDWRVLGISTLVITADHLIRGVLWPESVFGVLSASVWRSLEHAGWVLFEDMFLLVTIQQSLAEMRHIAAHRTMLEYANETTELKVLERTAELEQTQHQLKQHAAHLEQACHELSSAKVELNKTVDELQQKNRDLDEFTYVASHDLQEPVRKLISFSKLLKQDVGEELSPDAEKDLKFIVDAATRMRNLVQDLLALSRAGRSAMKLERISLDDCLDAALDSLDVRLSETAAEIVRQPMPEVEGDATTLTQLYQNLIGNALKFARQQPRITLTAQRQDDTWTFGVQDNGIGIKPEYCARIFQPFQRLHGRGEYEGTGIGLAICKKTVQRHDGKIWVESEPDLGAHFKFTLPAIEEDPSCDRPANSPEKELLSC